jgi:hypothetical protein
MRALDNAAADNGHRTGDLCCRHQFVLSCAELTPGARSKMRYNSGVNVGAALPLTA